MERPSAEWKKREGFELTYLPFVAKALCEALRDHPVLNARFQAGEGGQQGILLHGQVHLGVADLPPQCASGFVLVGNPEVNWLLPDSP